MESKESTQTASVDEMAALRTAQVLMQLSNMFRNLNEDILVEGSVTKTFPLEETPRNEEVALRRRRFGKPEVCRRIVFLHPDDPERRSIEMAEMLTKIVGNWTQRQQHMQVQNSNVNKPALKRKREDDCSNEPSAKRRKQE